MPALPTTIRPIARLRRLQHGESLCRCLSKLPQHSVQPSELQQPCLVHFGQHDRWLQVLLHQPVLRLAVPELPSRNRSCAELRGVPFWIHWISKLPADVHKRSQLQRARSGSIWHLTDRMFLPVPQLLVWCVVQFLSAIYGHVVTVPMRSLPQWLRQPTKLLFVVYVTCELQQPRQQCLG